MLDPKKFQEISKEYILKMRTPLELFAYYIPQFKEPGKLFCSDLRKDKNPSCVVYDSGLYVDYGTGAKYDIFSYLQEKYMCNFVEVLNIISGDFNLHFSKRDTNPAIFFGVKPKKQVEIKYKSIPFTQRFLDYYAKGHITKEILELYWIKQLKAFWVDDKYFDVGDKLCALQPEVRKGEWVYKIYFPENPKGKKFPVSNDGGAIYGLRQLPESDDLLFITSSKKDIMALRALDFYSIAGTSESVNFTEELFTYLKSRFKKIVLFYDNDEKGKLRSEQLTNNTQGLASIFTGSQQWKDPFELNSGLSRWKAKEKINNELRNI
jgi:hypothetical protein